MFLREPLLDWQREGRLLKVAGTGSSQAGDAAEDVHIAAKVRRCSVLSQELKQWNMRRHLSGSIVCSTTHSSELLSDAREAKANMQRFSRCADSSCTFVQQFH